MQLALFHGSLLYKCTVKQIGCFNHKVVTLVALLIFLSSYLYKTSREVISLLHASSSFSLLLNEKKRRKQQGNWLSYTVSLHYHM